MCIANTTQTARLASWRWYIPMSDLGSFDPLSLFGQPRTRVPRKRQEPIYMCYYVSISQACIHKKTRSCCTFVLAACTHLLFLDLSSDPLHPGLSACFIPPFCLDLIIITESASITFHLFVRNATGRSIYYTFLLLDRSLHALLVRKGCSESGTRGLECWRVLVSIACWPISQAMLRGQFSRRA